MTGENFNWIGKKARKTLVGLIVATFACSFFGLGIHKIKDYLINGDSRNYASIEVRSSDVEIRTPAKKVQPEFEIYTVKYGDTLSEIAERYSIPMRKIVFYNGIKNPDLIYENQRLRIPVKEKRK